MRGEEQGYNPEWLSQDTLRPSGVGRDIAASRPSKKRRPPPYPSASRPDRVRSNGIFKVTCVTTSCGRRSCGRQPGGRRLIMSRRSPRRRPADPPDKPERSQAKVAKVCSKRCSKVLRNTRIDRIVTIPEARKRRPRAEGSLSPRYNNACAVGKGPLLRRRIVVMPWRDGGLYGRPAPPAQPPPSALNTAIWSWVMAASEAATAWSALTSACSAVSRSSWVVAPARNWPCASS